MYDIKAVEFGQQQQQQQKQQQQTNEPKCNNNNKRGLTITSTSIASDICSTPTTTNYFLTNTRNYSTCNVLTANDDDDKISTLQRQHHHQHHHLPDKVNIDINTIATSDSSNSSTTPATHMTLLSLRRRRLIQRHACLISILAAFMFGLVLGVLMPMLGLANVFGGSLTVASASGSDTRLPLLSAAERIERRVQLAEHGDASTTATRPPSDFPTIYELRSQNDGQGADPAADSPFSVAFIKEQNNDLSADEVFRNVFHLEQDKNAPEAMIVKKLDSSDGSIKEFRVQRTLEGRFRKGPERRISKTSLSEQIGQPSDSSLSFVPMEQRIAENARNQRNRGIIKGDIYWGDLVEQSLPKGFSPSETKDWNRYVSSKGVVERLESGCGRMQNRLVVFTDGTRACARYRQNTDQIQGELFSFYLGQLLGLSNLAPSAPAVIDLESSTWSSAIADITQSQWKQQRPVVLTRWLPDLEPAGIPQPFQPLERHLNKYDVWNITLGAGTSEPHTAKHHSHGQHNKQQQAGNQNSVAAQQKGLLKRLEPASRAMRDHQSLPQPRTLNVTDGLDDMTATATATTTTTSAQQQPMVMQRLIELAQWSDLIVFDYLIANLDRVVNNLYNFQWNADIMAAPAHNLARQINTQLLVFLDNESGLLHGYRLLKKYEAYHGLLLDNLCVFRQPTIEALRELRTYGVGRKLREVFEQTTSNEVRDVLPSLPDKSIKILVDRIDRVLGQVQKCRDLLAER